MPSDTGGFYFRDVPMRVDIYGVVVSSAVNQVNTVSTHYKLSYGICPSKSIIVFWVVTQAIAIPTELTLVAYDFSALGFFGLVNHGAGVIGKTGITRSV